MKYQKTILGIIASVATAGILYGASLFANHWAKAGEVAEQMPKIEELVRSNQAVVKELADRAKAQDAKRDRDRELCIAKKITDRDVCAAAGYEVQE